MTADNVTPLRPGAPPRHIRLPLGMPKFEDLLKELLGYLAMLQDFDHNPPVAGSPIDRQEVATTIHTRTRWVRAQIYEWELLHLYKPSQHPKPPNYWIKLRTTIAEEVLSACRHEMERGSRQLTAAQHLAAERGDAGPRY